MLAIAARGDDNLFMETRPIIRNLALLAASLGSLSASYYLYERGVEDTLPQPAPLATSYIPASCRSNYPTNQRYESGNRSVANPDPCDLTGEHTTGYALNSADTSIEISIIK
jgi:hypothetical protein